jgi:hypothetical protein
MCVATWQAALSLTDCGVRSSRYSRGLPAIRREEYKRRATRMPNEHIPDAVRRLIVDRIDSVPELEAVLLLREHPSREWTADEAGRRLYVSTAVASHVLDVLSDRGFCVRNGDGFRYQPESPALGAGVDQLAEAYARHLVAVTNVIHSKPNRNLRDFVDAFRLRKPK